MAIVSAQEAMRFAMAILVMLSVWFSVTAYANSLGNAQHAALIAGMGRHVAGLVAYGSEAVLLHNTTYTRVFLLPQLPLDYSISLACVGGSLVVNSSSFAAGSTIIYPYINCGGKSVWGSAIAGFNCINVSRASINLVGTCNGTA